MAMTSRKHHYTERFQAHGALRTSGFTLTELMVSVGIIGILSAIALPNYLNSVNKARQADAANQISQIQSTIQAFREEYLTNPNSWSDLARITPVPSSAGPAVGSSFAAITTPNGSHYSLSVSGSSDLKTIIATPTRVDQRWDIKACLDTNSGFSDLRKGNGSQAAAQPICLGDGTS